MCRIAGIVDAVRYHDQLVEDVNQMITTMIHGGPDGRGIYTDKTISIGHCRLSLLDLSDAASQPMHLVSENLHISFNGEIYNFQEIKNELISRSHQFKTDSDTEVILHAFLEWGVDSFSKLNGMFAFALYDANNKKLYLVRDPNGIKPLYYFAQNNQLIFASESKAFKSFVEEENDFWKVLFLAYGHIPEPYTKWKDVYALPKSSYLIYNIANSSFELKKYKFKSSRNYANATIADIPYVLGESVKRHMIADAPIGLFLSGGIDSSILTLLASNYSNHLNTLSIYFNESEYSEKKYQDLIASKVNSTHHAILLQKEDFLNTIDSISKAYDSPSNDGVNTWFISKYAKEQKLKAVLSGLGADELFGGYPSFQRYKILKYLHQYKSIINKFSGSLPLKWERLYFLKLDDAVADYLLLRGFYAPSKIAKLLDLQLIDVMNILNTYKPNTSLKINSVKDVSIMEREMYMQNQLLKDSDFMSMQHGIEIRVPFLDNEFLELLNHIPTVDLIPNPGSKKTLIHSFENILPNEIYNRPKKGFQFPFKYWLKDSNAFASKFNSAILMKEYQLFQNDKIHWSKIWALSQL